MHHPRRTNDTTTERFTDGLMSQAHTQHRGVHTALTNDIDGNACFAWGARARRNHYRVRRHFLYVSHCQLIVAMHFERLAKLAQILHEIEGKRVVIVDDEYHGCLRTGVELSVHRTKILTIHMGVDLRRGNVRVSEHFLNGTEVGSALQQVRRKRMA